MNLDIMTQFRVRLFQSLCKNNFEVRTLWKLQETKTNIRNFSMFIFAQSDLHSLLRKRNFAGHYNLNFTTQTEIFCDCKYVTEIPIKTVRNLTIFDKPRCIWAFIKKNFLEIHHFTYSRQFNTLRNVKS